MIDSALLLTQLQSTKTSRTTVVKRLEDDLRRRCEESAEVDAPLQAQYEAAKAGKRTALTYKAWREDELTNIAVAWVLACVFIRFLEDNELVAVPKLSGPGARLQRARDEHELFFRQHPTATEREYLLGVFAEMGGLPGMKAFFDKKHNPLWLAAPSGEGCRELWQFWQKTDPETGALVHDFTDPEWNTRFLGDLYQDLSEAARKRYALLQTPIFIEQFILDRTLTPAIESFGFREVRMIDPTCGSAHFLLGGFERLFRLWRAECPGENPRVLAQRALDQVFGVDLNPNVVGIARFRLLLAALKACGEKRLKDAPDFRIHVAAGDALLHGRRFREMEGESRRQTLFESGEEVFRDELKHHYEVEDVEALHRILGQQYHAVVGNPPYITVKDRAVSELYRARYPSCRGKYSLSVPFMERFFDLAVKGDGTPQRPAGFVGQITSNSFMKREFGKKLIEEYLARWDLTHVLDTSVAYIPGHGTPTVILFGKNQPPVSGAIRTVLGIRGEESTPDDAAHGPAWLAIAAQIDAPGSVSRWVSAADSPRSNFRSHPWSIGGGGAAELKEEIEGASDSPLESFVASIGIGAVTGEDDAFATPKDVFRRAGIPSSLLLDFAEGDIVRDWVVNEAATAIFPYHRDSLKPLEHAAVKAILWPQRIGLRNRIWFRKTQDQRGYFWWEYGFLSVEKYSTPTSIAWGEVATHNHFVLDRCGRVFKQTAPVIKPKHDATEAEVARLVGILNSSTACFWMQQVCHNKGGPGGGSSKDEKWHDFYALNATKIAKLPFPVRQPTQIATLLVQASTALQGQSPAATLASWGGPESGELREWLASARDLATSHRCQIIAWQEELDWQIYEAFGLVEGAAESGPSAVSLPEGAPVDAISPEGIELGQRAFEIVLARRMAAGEMQSTWFERHGSTPITEVPPHWPAPYRELVERRIARIAEDPNIRLIEQPEYKRRWNTEPWDEQFTKAARDWLLARLEGYFFEGQRVCELKDGFDPSAAGFIAARQPALTTTSQLAGAAQTDTAFLAVAEQLMGGPGYSVPKLVRELVESASVPFLPAQRYKPSGLLKRHDWEHVWDLQREEDRIQAQIDAINAKIEARITERLRTEKADALEEEARLRSELDQLDREYHSSFFPKFEYNPDRPHHAKEGVPNHPVMFPEFVKIKEARYSYEAAAEQIKLATMRIRGEDEQIGQLERDLEALPAKPEVPVPPKYTSADFKKSVWWSLRGKLDVPKERWVLYLGTERTDDPSPVIAWAGWDHAQQARALAEYYIAARDTHGFPPDKLKLLLAGLQDLHPWLTQWHSAIDPQIGDSPANAIQAFLDSETHAQGITRGDLERVRVSSIKTAESDTTRSHN
jgi:hypothetical protein